MKALFDRFPALAAAFLSAFLALAGVAPASAQYVASPLQNGVPTGPSVTGSDVAHGVYFGTGRVGVSGHLEGGLGTGQLPVVSGCGTSSALTAGSTDTAGKITVGTTASNACILTFGTAYTAAPFCVVQNLTTGAAANVYVVTTTTITWSSALADSTVLMYHCMAPSGG